MFLWGDRENYKVFLTCKAIPLMCENAVFVMNFSKRNPTHCQHTPDLLGSPHLDPSVLAVAKGLVFMGVVIW